MTNPWKKLKQETIFDSGYRKLIRKTFELPNGKTHEFDIKDEMQVVCILGLTKENKVILVEEFRPGMEKTLLEIPGGQVEEGEDPTEAAKREFLEETGYTGEFQFVGTNYECAYSNQIKHNFVAKNCFQKQEQKLDPMEFAEVVELSLDEFRKHLRKGELTDVETGYLGLDYLKLL
ncbi:NUDIX hydrolase [Candidatus Falkowbacteria bacterium]|jgi:ADP-ribose pyrophosphatase|nr:NUDIX hydrolase [Candidatus Falkowbacteria bacterium]MBT5503283.1 NUDIX hydrolase [Candidatus Falkowbacteria bacterium]MBT6574508.1 NUDIX hydrolase [Candidatus Falkowbacteria bacterium]MBT7500916.1 NUDIX hydrolase [Candidatus Falkowbacteria bacterium]